MKEIRGTDYNLEIRPPAQPSIKHLVFLRELAEKGVFDSKPLSTPRGEMVGKLSERDIRKYVMQEAITQYDQTIK